MINMIEIYLLEFKMVLFLDLQNPINIYKQLIIFYFEVQFNYFIMLNQFIFKRQKQQLLKLL
jgi:hypothetical protein